MLSSSFALFFFEWNALSPKLENLKNRQNFLQKTVAEQKFLATCLLKFDRFSKTHAYILEEQTLKHLPKQKTQYWYSFEKPDFLRKRTSQLQKFLEKDGSRAEVSCNKPVKIWSFFEKIYIFWKSMFRGMFPCKKLNIGICSKNWVF